MEYKIVKVNHKNYSLFDDMIYWRVNGQERKPLQLHISQEIEEELSDSNLYIYAVEVETRYVGWIALIYMPKVGKYNGHGHVYIDELWIEPTYRRNGFAVELMKYAEVIAKERKSTGMRLYVNTNNPDAQYLYEKCGYKKSCEAYLMENDRF